MASILSCDLILKEYSNEINSVLDIKLFKINKPINEKGLAIWLTQEYYFLLELSKLFGVCLSKSTTTSGIKTLSRAINFIREDLDFLESKIIEMKIKINDIGLMKETKNYIESINNIYFT